MHGDGRGSATAGLLGRGDPRTPDRQTVDTLLIVTHVAHYRREGQWFAYEPYAREIELWGALFPKLLIAAPCGSGPVPSGCAAIASGNIELRPQESVGGTTVRAKIDLLLSLPAMGWSLARAMRRADAIHVRCPGNLGFLAAILAPLFCGKLIAKYAGQWTHYPGEPLTARLQRRLLASRWWHGPVMVYGSWPSQPSHVVSHFAASMTVAQIDRAGTVAGTRTPGPAGRLRVLHVGRLSSAKNVDVLLAAAADLYKRGVDVECFVVGDGPNRSSLQTLARAVGMQERVTFTGALPFERVLPFYERCDVLVLASETEGWPKAILEAMAHGVLCIGADRGFVPQMLSDGRGLVVPPRDVDELVSALERISAAPAAYDSMRKKAASWAGQYSLECLTSTLSDLIARHWGLALGGCTREIASA